ncbi:MAG: IS200/IS605 family transposase, partial [Alphaproteobacteria bacterium]|nr:IS200/IS605 family transposase [Alphaproteobacteria bacterium]
MSEYVHKSHKVSILMYHLVFPAKYRRVKFEGGIEEELKEICL